jgi:primosomal protein N' (replication factor Y)
MPDLTLIRANVCILNTGRDYFDYLATEPLPALGARVWVPFGRKRRMGIVVGFQTGAETGYVLKPIEEVIDHEPIFPEHLLTLCRWVSDYYQAPLSEVLPLALPKQFREGKIYDLPLELDYALALSAELAHAALKNNATRGHRLIEWLVEHMILCKSEIRAAGFEHKLVEDLLAKGILQVMHRQASPLSTLKNPPLTPHPEQAYAVERVLQSQDAYHCFLIDGVTGSGKTEVYLQVMAEILAKGKQVLVLVPEIGLTPQLLSRFTNRFHVPMAVVHSHLNDTERRLAWQRAGAGEVKLVIGTRGAIFTPMPNIGLIVIDEEHDASFKQMDRVRYSARDTALMRAYSANVPIILGSATPSLESLYNCERGKYTCLLLREKAISRTPLHFELLDIRNQPLHEGIATPTLHLIREHLQRQQQVLVFINRRGFSPVLLCHQCGWMADCRACDAHLTLHRAAGQLSCHHCGRVQPIPTQCGKCHSRELVPVGAGTQRIHDYLSGQFPDTQILRIDRDEVQKKQAMNAHLDKINRGEAQLIIGTQMLAKGHHFPKLTLVVVVDADNGFYNQDFRAIERLGQLLTQVAGRAGRELNAGHVLIQTHVPQHPLLNLLVQQGYGAFAESLLSLRKKASLPPYSFMAMLRAQSKTMSTVLHFLRAIKQKLHPTGIQLLGPAPAPLARKASYHRMQLLLQSPSRSHREHVLKVMREIIATHKLDKQIEWTIDVDPVDLS